MAGLVPFRLDNAARSGVLLAALAVVACAPAAGPQRPASTSRAGDVRTNTIGMKLVHLPAGEFDRGSPETEPGRQPNEGPVQRVRISRDFEVGAHEVTNGQFAAFVEATGYVTEAERDAAGGFGIDFETARVEQTTGIDWRNPGFPDFAPGPDHPVLLVSWNDAEAFCAWLSESEGRTYRLPTEAEWEYAARAGTSTAWWMGDDPAALREAGNVADASLTAAVPRADWGADWDDGHPFLAPVGSYAPNPFGLYDVHGNVWEWCSDWFSEDVHATSDATDPTGPPKGAIRTIRGGGWFNSPVQQRSAQRIYFHPRFRYCLLSGFRVVCEVH